MISDKQHENLDEIEKDLFELRINCNCAIDFSLNTFPHVIDKIKWISLFN